MPFEKTPETLNRLIDSAIAENSDLRAGLERVGYEKREFHEEIAGDSDKIWEVALSDIRKYDVNESQVQSRLDASVKELGEPPNQTGGMRRDPVRVTGACIRFYVIALMGIGIYVLVVGWHVSFGGMLARYSWWVVSGFAILPVLLMTMLIVVLRWAQRRSDRARAIRTNEWEKKRAEVEAALGIASATKELEEQVAAIDMLLLERIKLEMNTAINRRTAPSYVPRLEIKRPRGFGEVFDKRFTILTPARKRLQFMLENMPGGSIGIAGSRGAGKTTLLKQFCGPKRIIDTLGGKPVLGVLVSAPVAYQARDFILYLFSATCQNLIEAEGGKYALPVLPTDEPVRFEDTRVYLMLRPLPQLILRVGLVLALLSVVLAMALDTLQSLPGTSAATQPANSTVAAGPASPSPTSSGQLDSATPSESADGKTTERSFRSTWIGLLQIDPAPFLVWAIGFMIVALILAAYLGLSAWGTFLISIAGLLRSILGWIPGLRDPWLRLQHRMARIERERHSGRRIPGAAKKLDPDSLQGRAETWLKAIKFQQSYTTGWSGSLKLPIGLEGGVSRAVTLAQNQLSLPEIGHFLMRLLEDASLKYQVIIGIDEMDKLASDELAQQFINDIKSIFGLERCFYLISVSENAMSNFERRGLPFRDVFDSAFDDFVYVDHLEFDSAKELLEQRIIGRPIPFFALSYCMSGGLARDLIRNFRSVLEAYEQNRLQNSLTEICGKVVAADLLAKVRATRISAKKIKLESEVDLFLESLYAMENGVGSDDALTQQAASLLSTAAVLASPPKVKEDKDLTPQRLELSILAEEVATYVYYAVTLRQLFNDQLREAALTKPPVNGSLDTMAKARQILGLNPAITRSLLKAFRVAHGLQAFPSASLDTPGTDKRASSGRRQEIPTTKSERR